MSSSDNSNANSTGGSSGSDQPITKLIGNDLGNDHHKWYDLVHGKNGSFYAIPFYAKQVGKFHVKTKSWTLIGPELEGRFKWSCGVLGNNGVIYCAPFEAKSILKIDTKNDVVEEMTEVQLPKEGNGMWKSGALGDDNCIYYFPANASRILKFDQQNETASSVGNDFGCDWKFRWTLKGKDNNLYGLNQQTNKLIRYDTSKPNVTVEVGERIRLIKGDEWSYGKAVIGKDGCIYRASYLGNVCRIDTENGSHSWIRLDSKPEKEKNWAGAVIGSDKDIYWAPGFGITILKLNINAQKLSLEKCQDESIQYTDKMKWIAGKLAPNGHIYFIPYYANQILEVDTRPPHNMTRKSAVRGLNDNLEDSPDRLGYNVYADGLSEVVRSVENPSTSLCAALFGPWGSGKSFLWKLIKHDLETISNQSIDKIKEEMKKIENAPVVLIERSCALAWVSWCTFARMLSSVFCRRFSNLKEEEKVALMMIFSFPVGIPLWIVVFAGNVVPRIILILVCYGLWIVCGLFKYNYEKYQDELDEDESLNKYMHLGFQGIWRSISGLEEMKKKDNVFIITTCCSPSSEELKWSSVREVLFSNPDLYEERDMSGSGCAIYVLLIILSFFQQIFNSVIKTNSFITNSFIKDYEIDKHMTKYVFVEFNAWIYRGTDNLWAKLLEMLWKSVEEQCGEYQVRMHRVSIKLSREKLSDNIQTRSNKRKAALIEAKMKIITCTIIAIVVVSIVISSYVKDIQMKLGAHNSVLPEDIEIPSISHEIRKWLISIASVYPAIYYYINYALKIIPELQQSRGAKILQDARTFESHIRQDFSERTGFMGEVHQEVKYLFDFLRTHYTIDEKAKRRRPIRLALFVDDLDRCPENVVMSILEATILFLVDAPITCWLAIDSRLVVASIEKYYGETFKKAGLGGYEFLEKIIQLPFCLPDLDENQKRNFLEKSLESSELDPVKVYKRLKYLEEEKVEGMKELCEGMPDDISKNNDTVLEQLINVLENMMEKNILEKVMIDEFALKNPADAIMELGKLGNKKPNPDFDRLQDELLHWISKGIEEVLDIHRSKKAQRRRENTETPDRNADEPGNNPRPLPGSVRPSEETPLLPPNVPGIDQKDEESFGNLDSYGKFFQSMVSHQELEWFQDYSSFFIGKPRKMKRILNSYMVSRFIADKLKQGITVDSFFHKNLLKFTILLEQWPFRMAWMLLIIENLQKEIAIRDYSPQETDWNVGESMSSIVEAIRLKHATMNRREDLPLIHIYRCLVKVIMHSSGDSVSMLKSDGDPQAFEQILLHDGDKLLKIKDISLPGQLGCENTLRPYAFNLQRHMIENVSADMENLILGTKGDVNDWYIIYEKKSVFHKSSSFS